MSIADELERLHALHECGALSTQEYERAKAHVLGAEAGSDTAAGTGTAADTGDAIGTGEAAGSRGDADFFRRLARSRHDRFLGGVCGGLGRHTDLPSWAWRLIFCLVTIYFGAGILFYVLLWVFLPLEN
jgi:phage shock protein PspC (stress-responsive transcriptional regulator)